MNVIKELWHANIIPQEDSRNNSPEMKQLMECMARHQDDLLKTMTTSRKRYWRGSMIVGASIRVMPKKPYSSMLSSSVRGW